jgi:DNA-binding CsgD family transcriptional regulator
LNNQESSKPTQSHFGIDTDVRLTAMSALATDPSVAVTLMRDDGKILWGNERAAKLWAGEHATVQEYIGRDIKDLQPKEWNSIRQEIFARVRSGGRPVVLRLMWKAKQYFSLFRLIKGSLLEHDRFLIVTRHVPSEEPTRSPIDSTFELMEADAIGLGHLDVLTPRELEVLALVGQGMSTKEISRALSRSEKTIENHRYSIGKKLESSSPVRLAEIARQAGLTVKDAERGRVH